MPEREVSKAGRNESRKLAANALNNIGVAFVLAALLQPALAFVQQDRPPGLATAAASLIFMIVALVFFARGRGLVRQLED
jgi:predicted transporter